MVFAAEVAVALLLIIVHAEGQSLACSSTCEPDSTAEGDQVEFRCQLDDFDGRALLAWYYLDREGWKEIRGIKSQDKRGSLTIRYFSAKAEAPSLVPRVCLVRGVDVDVDIVNPKCEIEKCEVLHSVRNVVTSPMWNVSPGEEITCVAEGNPKPTYRWQRMNTTGSGKWDDDPNEKSNKINALLIDGNSVALRCVAENAVRNETYIERSTEVIVSKHGKIIRIAIIVGCCVGALVVLVIVFVVYKKVSDLVGD